MKAVLSILLSITICFHGLFVPGVQAAVEQKRESAQQEKRSAGDALKEDNVPKIQKKVEIEKKRKTQDQPKNEAVNTNLDMPRAKERRLDQGEQEVIKEEGGRKEPESDTLSEQISNVSDEVDVTINQGTITRELQMRVGESISNEKKTGYTAVKSRTVMCRHVTEDILGSIKCKKGQIELHPTKQELLNNVELTGLLKEKKVKKRLQEQDVGGEKNIVSHWWLFADVDAPGIKEEVLAGPYVCPNDSHAAYSYFERYYSYCPNTETYFALGSSHVWLGCSNGDSGEPETHLGQFSHKFDLYQYVPNQYKIVYDANGGQGSLPQQNAEYGEVLDLFGSGIMRRTGYTMTGWNTKRDGTGTSYELGQKKVKNLTSKNGGKVTMYAQWRPNSLKVRYHPNGGKTAKEAAKDIETFFNSWTYITEAKKPAGCSSFGITKEGYSRKSGAEWNTKANGTGRSFDEDREYDMTDYAPKLTDKDREITLYAQWEPKIYTVILDNRLVEPMESGTGKIYKKYETGMYFDKQGLQKMEHGVHQIVVPAKDGYKFKGYYDAMTNGKEMINAAGKLTESGEAKKRQMGKETWYAQYDLWIGCEDYADIPCDLQKTGGDPREDLAVKLVYNSGARKVTVITGQEGCTVSLAGKPSGTWIGNFQSFADAPSIAGSSGRDQKAELSLAVLNGTAYQLKVVRGGRILCDKLVYFYNGRFRTLVKLGVQKARVVSQGEYIAGSAWGTKEDAYVQYQYDSCSQIKQAQEPENVYRYFKYKDVNMAYSGNGATMGVNILECGVSLENLYQFRKNQFHREEIKTKHTKKNQKYECVVKYAFQGWEMTPSTKETLPYSENQKEQTAEVYETANKAGAVSYNTADNIHSYQKSEPFPVFPGLDIPVLSAMPRTTGGNGKESMDPVVSMSSHSAEYINFQAIWNAFPTIVVTPGEKLEFYEGEEVAKEKLIRRLTAHDEEDNKDMESNPDLNDKLRIVKISYPESKNHSKKAYQKVYREDVPDDFLLDTYYLNLEQEETVQILVTFAVTDSAGNTSEEELPVTVKYNNYPEISSEDIFYYLKEEANRGEITEEKLIRRATAEDVEDGDISRKLKLRDFDPQELKMQTEPKAEFSIIFQVTDAYKKTAYKTVKVMVWDGDAAKEEMPKYYVRFISEKYLDTLEQKSIWRRPENFAELKSILQNDSPIETWIFSNDDVLAIQDWIVKEGEGRWKIGQEANQHFLLKFAQCKK